MATEKTANDYREERKARLAKASKQNTKKSHRVTGPKISSKAKTAITSIVCAAIVIAVAYSACANLGVFARMKTIKTVSGESYSAVEYEYYYKTVHNYYYQMARQYDEYYGEGYGYYYTGYNYSKLPEDQEYPRDDYTLEDGSKATWKQYFEHMAVLSLQQYTALADMADKAGFKVSDEATAKAEEQLNTLREDIKANAESQNGQVVSLGKYLRSAYGKGMTEKIFKGIIERETKASEYTIDYAQKTADGYDIATLEAEYKKDPSIYNNVNFRMFSISPETPELADDATEEQKKEADDKAKAEAKKKADEMFEKITDEASFIKLAGEYATDEQKENTDFTQSEATLSEYVSKESVASSFSESVINWLFGKDAKANEKKLFDENGTYFLFYMLKPSFRDDTTMPVDVRHILYGFDAEATDKDADDKKQKAYADEACKKIKESKTPVETLIEICEKDSTDTGSKDNGGLYERVVNGQMVKPFQDWALDPARKEGDCEVVKTTYGYHVMYFVKAHNKPLWQLTIADALAGEKLDKEVKDAVATDAYTIAKDNKVVAGINDRVYNELLSTYYAGIEADKKEVSSAAA